MSKKPVDKSKETREQRLRAQLRANLQKRKGQARLRVAEADKNNEQEKG